MVNPITGKISRIYFDDLTFLIARHKIIKLSGRIPKSFIYENCKTSIHINKISRP